MRGIRRDGPGKSKIHRADFARLQQRFGHLQLFRGRVLARDAQVQKLAPLMKLLVSQRRFGRQFLTGRLCSNFAGPLVFPRLQDEILVLLAEQRLSDTDLNDRGSGPFKAQGEAVIVSEARPRNHLGQVQRPGFPQGITGSGGSGPSHSQLRRAIDRHPDSLLQGDYAVIQAALDRKTIGGTGLRAAGKNRSKKQESGFIHNAAPPLGSASQRDSRV